MRERHWQRWELVGLFVVLAAGNLLHFVYEWSGRSSIAALFAGVNESTWEHMKLLAVPWILWSAVQTLALRGSGMPVPAARAMGLLAGIAAIPTLFYTYTGVLGRSVSLVNIIIFQLAVLLAFGVSWWVHSRRALSSPLWQLLGAAVLLALAALFVWWTFQPPQLPVFADPTTTAAGLPE